MRSPTAARMPSVAILPLTLMRPASMCSSILRLAPSPARDITFCRRSSPALGAAARASARAPACRRPVLFSLAWLLRFFGLSLLPGAFRLVGWLRFGPVPVFFRGDFVVGFDSLVGAFPDRVLRFFFVGLFRLLVVFLRLVLLSFDLLVMVCRLGKFGVVELEFRFEVVEVPDLGQRGQIIETLEDEVVEEDLGRPQQFGLARNVAMAHHLDPFAFLQRLQDIGAQRDTANLLDFAPGDGLAIGDDASVSS